MCCLVVGAFQSYPTFCNDFLQSFLSLSQVHCFLSTIRYFHQIRLLGTYFLKVASRFGSWRVVFWDGQLSILLVPLPFPNPYPFNLNFLYLYWKLGLIWCVLQLNPTSHMMLVMVFCPTHNSPHWIAWIASLVTWWGIFPMEIVAFIWTNNAFFFFHLSFSFDQQFLGMLPSLFIYFPFTSDFVGFLLILLPWLERRRNEDFGLNLGFLSRA